MLGRCADEILAYNPNLIRVFITGDKESKVARVMEREGLERKQAETKMRKVDKMRKHITISTAKISGVIQEDMICA